MVKYLLDTNVLSEHTRPRPDRRVMQWFETVPEDSLFLSIITIGEIHRGIEKLKRTDRNRAKQLNIWLSHLLGTYRDRILNLSLETAFVWGKLTAEHPQYYHDAFIAATALAQSMTVVTRNVKDFTPLGVELVNPWEAER